MAINFFNSLEYLEPRCKGCDTVLEYGINTSFDSVKDTHICNKCGSEIR